MLLKMFTVYDSKSELYLQPFYSSTTGQALRSFEDTCQDTNHQFNKHAADFTLFEIGVFDDSAATILMQDVYINLGCAIEYINDSRNTQPTNSPLKDVNANG